MTGFIPVETSWLTSPQQRKSLPTSSIATDDPDPSTFSQICHRIRPCRCTYRLLLLDTHHFSLCRRAPPRLNQSPADVLFFSWLLESYPNPELRSQLPTPNCQPDSNINNHHIPARHCDWHLWCPSDCRGASIRNRWQSN